MASLEPSGKTLSSRLSRRRLVQGLGLGAAGMVLGHATGCGGQQSAPTVTGQQDDKPIRGGTLRIAQKADITPKTALYGFGGSNYFLLAGVYDTLTRYRSDRLEAEPELAESWDFSSDHTSLTVKLRSDVRFHSGRPLTSEDVKWNIETAADPSAASLLVNFVKWIKKIETPSQSSLVLQFDQPRPTFLDLFENLMIADPQTYQDTVDGKNFVGTGPFVFKEWVPGDHFTMVRNPDYWLKGQPYLDEVVVRLVPDSQSQLIFLQSGNADVARELDARDAQSLRSDRNYVFLNNPVMPGVNYAGLDVKSPPFDDKRVRQAIALLIDRKRILDSLLFFGQVTEMPWDQSSPAYVPELANKNDYSPDKAKGLLGQAGAALSSSFPIYPGPSAPPQAAEIAELLQAEFTKVGLKPTVEKLTSAQFNDKLTNLSFRGMWVTATAFVHMNPSALFFMTRPYRVPNPSNFDTPEYRRLIDAIGRATDAAELKKVYREINELLLEECFVIPISTYAAPLVASAKVKAPPPRRGNIELLRGYWKKT